MDAYLTEDVIKDAKEAFAETIALKAKQLRRYIPKKRDETNTDLTGAFVEELVRGFIRGWIGERRLIHGTLYAKADAESCERAMQIDGIIHDPRSGPAVISEGDFGIIHPAFCAGVIEIKMSVSDLGTLEERLQTIHRRYMHDRTSSHVMGVVIADADPQKTCVVSSGEKIRYYHDYARVGWCPIFVLFKETDETFEPFYPAIDALIRATRRLHTPANYL